MAGTAIKVIDNAKYLGLVIDNKLNFQQLLNMLECEISRAVGMMFTLKIALPHITLLQ